MTELERLGRELARDRDELLQRVRPDAGLDPVRIAMPVSARPPRRRALRMALALAAVSAAAGALLLVFMPSQRALRVRVGGVGSLPAGSIIEATAGDTPLTFSDGSTMILATGAAARITSIGAHGAHITLERGRARVSVVHRHGTSWELAAGPCTIAVTGTRFALELVPGRELELAMEEGSVRVTGAGLRSPRALHTGERLHLTSAGGTWTAGEPEARSSEPAGAAPISAPAPARTPAARPAAPSAAPDTVSPGRAVPAAARTRLVASSATAPGSAWRELLRAGRHREALADLGHDFEAACSTAGPADLAALGNAARFAGDSVRARQAYLALTVRFPTDPRMPLAVFTLGRIASEMRHDHGDAAAWFERYLRSFPSGELRAEAAGRLIEEYVQVNDRAGARRAAQGYLAAYPDGVHAEMARRALGRD